MLFYKLSYKLFNQVRTRQHLHRDDSGASWLSSQLDSTLDVAEAVLQDQLGLAQQIRQAQLNSGKMSLVINDVVCCAPRRCKVLGFDKNRVSSLNRETRVSCVLRCVNVIHVRGQHFRGNFALVQ